MEKNESELHEISIETFNKVNEFLKEIGIQERHFNDLCGKYKALASTWLLSTFAGIGFVLINSVEPKFLLISGIGCAGSIGVFMLWFTDLKVYQQLLSANFVEGLKLEKKYNWLPSIRQNIVKTQPTGKAISYLYLFYISGIIIPLLICLCSISLYLSSYNYILCILSWFLFPILVIQVIRFLTIKSDEVSLKEHLSNQPNPSLKVIHWIIGSILFFVFAFMNINEVKNHLKENSKEFQVIHQNDLKLNTNIVDSVIINKQMLNMNEQYVFHKIILSNQMLEEHSNKKEFWYIISGSAELRIIKTERNQIIKLHGGDYFYLPLNSQYKILNNSACQFIYACFLF